MAIEASDLATRLSRIPGWGADLKPENRPGVPKEKKPPGGTGAHWTQPERQAPTVRIHKTFERRGLTPVFGTTCPPKGLSGKLRDAAYALGEDRISHWMLLLVADRVDMVETIVSEVLRGKAGNPFSEMGLGVEFKERGRFARMGRKRAAIAIAVGVGSLGIFASRLSRGRKAA